MIHKTDLVLTAKEQTELAMTTEEWEKYNKNKYFYLKVLDFLEEEIWWNVEKLWQTPIQWGREIKYFIQRGKRGYSDFDLWGFDSYLEKMLPLALRDLAQRAHGYPVEKPMDTFEKWQKFLNEIADDIESVRVVEDRDYNLLNDKNKKNYNKYRKDLKEARDKQKKALKSMADWFGNLWD